MVDAWGVTLRCLIVDDNEAFLESASGLLRREGVDVVGLASTIAQARRLVAELRPDVTLVDVDLGEEDGFELAAQLGGNSRTPHSRVILVSTHSEEDLSQLIEASPALGFVSKARLSAQAIAETLERAGDA
jgi:DNA-binding NarL/FixJ family response regulator